MVDPNIAYQLEQGDLAIPPTGRPVIYATQGVISSGHYLTSMAGMRILVAGGNAFDALVAASFAAAVVEPIASYSLGAEGVFMLRDAASNRILSLSGQGGAPAKATAAFYLDQGLKSIPTGPGPLAPLSFTVPGVVHALLSMLERYGTKSVAEILAPAIEYSERGIPNYEYMLSRLGAMNALNQFDEFPPGGSEIFYHDRKIPVPGTLLIQKTLSGVLKTMVKASGMTGSKDRSSGIRAARDCFYVGTIGRMIADCSSRVGGILDLNDLAGYSAEYDAPVKISFNGYEIHGHSTWTQGPVLMQALNILEKFDLKTMGHNTALYVHVITEALKLALADREAYYGDPKYASIPVDGLLSKEYAASRANGIDTSKAFPEMPSCGDPWLYSSSMTIPSDVAPYVGEALYENSSNLSSDDGGTTHIAVLDQEGNMVCATPSGGAFTKSVFFSELGFALSTRMEMFNLEEGHPNLVEPGKRPRTTLVNYMVSKAGVPTMTIGCPGGDAQAQANLQLILNTLVFGMNPQQAIEAPRFSSLSVPNSFYPHVYSPGRLAVEATFPEETVERLRSLGHEVVRYSACGMGATVALRNPDTGILSAGGDPRRACYAIGW